MQDWYAFLQSDQQHPASIENGRVIHFGDPVAEMKAVTHEAVLCDLSHLGLLDLQGVDAQAFLQGQLTNDIKQLNGERAQYTAYCNPKGRMLAFFLAFSTANHYYLQLPLALTQSIAKRLTMFVMRSKVTIHDAQDSIIKIGLSGIHASALLAKIFNSVPEDDLAMVAHEKATLIKLPGIQPRYQIFATIDEAQDIWQALAQSAKPVGAQGWEWLEIQAGIPNIETITQEAFVPQMLNLDALNAINYKKGCYTGQEIVARTHYLGKVKRRMQLAQIETLLEVKAPAVGDDLVDDGGQAVGKIVRVALDPMQHEEKHTRVYDVLVECRLDSLDEDAPSTANEVLSLSWQSHPIHIKTLPYNLAV